MADDNNQFKYSEEFRGILSSYLLLGALCAARKMNLFSILKEEDLSLDEIARRLSIHKERLGPIIQLLEEYKFLRTKGEIYLLSPKGENFFDDGGNWYHQLILTCDEYLPASMFMFEALKSNNTAFELAHGVDPWARRSRTDSGRVFDLWLEAETQSTSRQIVKYIIEHLEPRESIIDIGSGLGSILLEVKKTYPESFTALLDLPEVIKRAREKMEGITDSSIDSFLEGNILESVPSDFDVYFMKSVLHDFNQELARLILLNIRRNLLNGSRIFLVERCFDRGSNGNSQIAELNLLMSVVHGSHERSRFEWLELFKEVNLEIKSEVLLSNGFTVFELLVN